MNWNCQLVFGVSVPLVTVTAALATSSVQSQWGAVMPLSSSSEVPLTEKKQWWDSHLNLKPNTSTSLSHYTQARSDAGRSNQSLSACPLSFNTHCRLINPTLDRNNLTISQSHSQLFTEWDKMLSQMSTCEVLPSPMWYLKLKHLCKGRVVKLTFHVISH